jgi:hypothetical protein
LVPNLANLADSPGHGQPGNVFECKTRFLQRPLRHMLQNSAHTQGFSSFQNVEFYYPSGPLRADPDHPQNGSNGTWHGVTGIMSMDVSRVSKTHSAIFARFSTKMDRSSELSIFIGRLSSSHYRFDLGGK